LLVRLYPDVRQASDAQLEAACAAMRAKSRAVIDELIDDAKDAPGVAHIAFQTAALTLAHEGIQALKAGRKKICEARQKKLGFQVEQRLNAITINDATRSRT
jgi:anthranilate phosphoribosyltransferase